MKKALSFFLTALMLCSLFTVLACPVSAYSAARPANGDYYICASSDNGYCVDITGGSTAMQTLAQLWERTDNNAAQIFTIKRYSGDYYKIYHKASGYILNIQSGIYSNGTRIWLWSSDDSTNASLWRFLDTGDGNYILQNRSGYVLDLDNNLLYCGSRLHVWSYHEGASARWKLVSANGKNSTVTGTVNTFSANLIMRSGPGTSYSRVTSMPKGAQVTILSTTTQNGFYNIRYGSYTGWASAAYIRINNNDDVVTSFQWPMNNHYVTQSFGKYSSSMARKYGRPYHSGIDMKSYSDNTIYAAATGTVEYSGYSSGNGYHIILSHNFNGTTVKTLYSHLVNLNSCPAKGATVTRGTKIGVMGNTGNSTGPHLHFAIFTGNSTDPVGYTAGYGSQTSTHGGCTFYNPSYVITYNRLP